MTPEERHDLDEIASVLSNIAPPGDPAVLVGWVCIAEYSDLEGRRWLGVRSGASPDSEHMTTSWQRRGYLSEALASGWHELPEFEINDDEPDSDG